jgi:tetratricopeptide (TPR) repeat protein
MKPLLPPDSHHVAAASGWMGLGKTIEAAEELEKIQPANQAHPDVLEILWQIHAKSANWNICLDIARGIIKLDPQRPSGWMNSAAALFGLKRTQEAFDELNSVAERFPKSWRIHYALACYCAQLRRFIESQLWLNKAMAIERKAVTALAAVDPNLMPLWLSLRGKNISKPSAAEPGQGPRGACVNHAPSLAKSTGRMSLGL